MSRPRRRHALLNKPLASLLMSAGLALGAAMPVAARAETIAAAGQRASETRPVGAFQAIATAGDIDLHIRQGQPAAVTVQADRALLPRLETVVEDGTLQVRWKRGFVSDHGGRSRVEITTPQLQSLHGSGAGKLRVEALQTPRLAVALSGSGDLRLDDLACDELTLDIAGSADILASGRATTLRIKISGSGDVRAQRLQADAVVVAIAGSGDAALQAHKTLSVTIAGSGDVSYSGEAALSSSIAGSGRVRRR